MSKICSNLYMYSKYNSSVQHVRTARHAARVMTWERQGTITVKFVSICFYRNGIWSWLDFTVSPFPGRWETSSYGNDWNVVLWMRKNTKWNFYFRIKTTKVPTQKCAIITVVMSIITVMKESIYRRKGELYSNNTLMFKLNNKQ